MKMKRGLLAAGLVLFMSALAYTAFFQGFETDTNGWVGATRVSRVLTACHQRPAPFTPRNEFNGNTYTLWGGSARHFQSVDTPPRWTSISTFRLPT